jgi:hypothetical protein
MGEFEDKTETLSDADTTWTTVRHMHMREAIDKLMHDFNTFLQENAGFKGYLRDGFLDQIADFWRLLGIPPPR